ncbi:TetR/AcrR family transcriptional regulator [Herbidospora sp. NBRC 101105]|uniref:TetR/AcrR family transcriptional regulator n=1 Tax=Herbidospora sp. NBRC 101105 TaxID=3032195 RepID=UPI0024A2E136|nr:TetR/AcrR family transcriptional regulator [Herbidospora sp. NBRC 101105]GLX92098.1 TetR family transcriptional regulator [Herbidospora sp. NBRC 101105]
MTQRKSRADRRVELIDAARRAMIQHGAEGVHLNQIAEEAGLTSGAVLYHYPDLRDLLIEAHHAGMERFYEQRVKKISGIADPAQKLITTIRSGLPEGPDDAGVRLLCELGGAAGRNRVYGTLLTTLYDRQVAMYQTILEIGAAQGVFKLAGDSEQIARNLVALEDAYGYRIIARHHSIGPDEAVGLILDFARMSTGHPLKETPAARPKTTRTPRPRNGGPARRATTTPPPKDAS